MKAYVWVSFAFMGWAYYEMSGGADFVPERPVETQLAEAQPEGDPLPEIVTRADTASLISISTSNAAPEGSAQVIPAALETDTAPTEATAEEALSQALALQEVDDTAVQVAPDVRTVAGSRVNMRQGPGTNFGVIVTLTQGTEVEVLEVSASGWARLVVTDSGAEGWMAERLLTDPS